MQSCVVVGKVGVECVCMYCRKVYRNPMSFKHCKHVFCAQCAEKMRSETRRCHLCAARVELNDITECKSCIFLFCLLIGPVEVLRKVNDLKVACRKNDCVWHGKLGAYPDHSCPSPVSDGEDVGKLQFLLLFDERDEVKIAAFENIGRRVFNARRTAVNENFLSMLYLYSIRLNDLLEVQRICLDVLLEVIGMREGVDMLLNSCEGVTERMCTLSTVACLRSRAVNIVQAVERWHEPGEKVESAVGFLARARQNSVGQC